MEATTNEMMMDEISLLDIWRVLVRRKWLILLLFVATVVGAYVASSMMTPIYQATTSVLIKDAASGLQLPLFEDLANQNKSLVQNYIQVLKSRTLAEKTARALGLPSDPTDPDFNALRESITVKPVQGTDALQISVEHKDPELAMRIANELVRQFQTSSQEANREEARSAREFIESQLKVVEQDLRRAEQALKDYKERQRIVQPSEEAKAVLDKLTALEQARAEATVGLQEGRTRLAELRRLVNQQAPTLVSASVVADNPMVQQYRSRLAELEVELAGARERYTDRHPAIVGLQAEIAEVRRRLTQEVQKVVTSETRSLNPLHQSLLQEVIQQEAQLVALQARVDATSRLISAYQREVAGLPQKELELARLERNMRVTEQIYLMLRQKYEEVRITEAMKTANVQVIDQAVKPQVPIKPRKKLNMAVAGFLGLFVGCGLAFLLEYADVTIKTAEEVESQLGIPVLGRIPEEGTLGRGVRRQHGSAGPGFHPVGSVPS